MIETYGWPNVEVPPYCPMNESDMFALETFEDEVIDQLYLLNSERSSEEARPRLGAGTVKRGGLKKPYQTNSNKSEATMSLPGMSDGEISISLYNITNVVTDNRTL